MAARIEIRTDKGTLDLPENFHQDFYVTRQIFDLKNFQTRNADYTKTVFLPATPNNIAILGAIADTSGTATAIENTIGCTILMDGITLAVVAKLIFGATNISRDGAEFECTIFYGNFNLFDALSGQTLDKLN